MSKPKRNAQRRDKTRKKINRGRKRLAKDMADEVLKEARRKSLLSRSEVIPRRWWQLFKFGGWRPYTDKIVGRCWIRDIETADDETEVTE